MTQAGVCPGSGTQQGGAASADETFEQRLTAVLRQPVSRGFALVLVALNLLVIAGMLQRQQEVLDEVRYGAPSVSYVPEATDDDVCAVVGALARANGDGEALLAALADVRNPSDCMWRASSAASGEMP